VVVIPAGREEGGHIAEALDDIKAQDVVIEGDLPIEVGDFEMGVPDVGARGD
jgi:hypothetical protein